ncbi:bacteriohemerythrin [Roseospira marina]|nr:bacteriohemerythrin [Roseospira marina]MBB4314943.1 hemerythrin [Roseospira marina]MBB5087943.1 hemerythrin [Roseospira marina]
MTVIEWTEEMSVGVEALDHDHQRLFSLLNQLHEVIVGGESRESLRAIVHELVRYTEYHFECEERLMRLTRYPELDAHVRTHRDIRRRIVSFEQKFQASPDEENARHLFEFLSEWLTGHILGDDMKYRPYMSRESASCSADR